MPEARHAIIFPAVTGCAAARGDRVRSGKSILQILNHRSFFRQGPIHPEYYSSLGDGTVGLEQPYAHRRRELIEPDWQRLSSAAFTDAWYADPVRRYMLPVFSDRRSRASATAPELVR